MNLLGFLGAIGLSLSTDKRAYQVGDQPVYKITGAVPGSIIAWTSYKNNQSTGEYNANYGQTVDANGTAELTGGAWAEGDVGQWQKELVVIAPDGTITNTTTSFSVNPKPSAQTPGTNTSGNFFDGNVTLPVVGSVSKVAALGGAVILGFVLFKGRR